MRPRILLTAIAASALLLSPIGFAANHREAPITALDHKADIADWFTFVSYDNPSKVTMILNVDPLLEPGNGPNYFPFDPDILYEMKIDNNHDAVEDVVFQFRFFTEQRLPDLFTVYAGVPGGAVAPANAPPPATPGTLVVPDRIRNFEDPGLGLRQRYSVTMVNKNTGRRTNLTGGSPPFAVPANVGPRTMDYAALFDQGIYDLGNGIRAFAGTVDDPFWIDLGGAFDTFNTQIFPVLTPAQDAATSNFAADFVSGYSVNTIALEVPIELLTRTRTRPPASDPAATIGTWGTTSRQRITVRRPPLTAIDTGSFTQIQRMGNALINELLIGTGKKDRFSMDQPKNDSQFADFFLDPALARIINALTNGDVAIPAPPRNDLLPVVQYAPPIAPAGTPPGPIADLLRLNTGVSPTPGGGNRLGLLGGDPAGFPNGRRVSDDVTDIALRLVVGGVLAAPFPGYDANVNNRLGDGVNVNDVPYLNTFPYVGHASSGRDRRHIDPGELGTTPPEPTDTTTFLTSNPNPSDEGQPVAFDVSVSSAAGPQDIPEGTVEIFVDGVLYSSPPLANGEVTVIRADLAVGSHKIEAKYRGNANFNGSTSNVVSQVVNPRTPQLIFTGLGSNPFSPPPAGAVAWRVRNPMIGHIDSPFALPGASNPLGLPVAPPGMSIPGATWTGPDGGCSFFHLHGTFQGHGDPASGNCGHGGLEWGTF
jgi:hypothetical protein